MFAVFDRVNGAIQIRFSGGGASDAYSIHSIARAVYDAANGAIHVTAPNFEGAGSSGLVPDPGVEAGKYLKDDGTWETPAGGGGGYSVYVEEADVAVGDNSAADITLDFDGTDFNTSIAAQEIEITVNDGGIDHDSLANTHNLTTDIDHASITNTHNLTTDIDHNALTNTHNLTTDIDHDALTNFAANEHVVLPGTIANVLTDHDKAAHDALTLSHDSLLDVSTDDHHAETHALNSHTQGSNKIFMTNGAVFTEIAVGTTGLYLQSGGADVDLVWAAVDHNAITNTHNLTTDIDHNALTNTHNITTDIDHDTLTNTHNLTTDIDHASITNAHNLTTDIDHDALTNFAAGEHFTEASIDHTAITNIGTTSHGDIDTHIADTIGNPHDVDATEITDFDTEVGNHTDVDANTTARHTRSHAVTGTSDHTAGNHKTLYSDGSGQIQELTHGTSTHVLTSNGATSAPSWQAAAGGGASIALFQARRTAAGNINGNTAGTAWGDVVFNVQDHADTGFTYNTGTGQLAIGSQLNGQRGLFSVGVNTAAGGTSRVELIIELQENQGESFTTILFASNYSQRDNDQNTGGVWIANYIVALNTSYIYKIRQTADWDAGTPTFATNGCYWSVMAIG